MRNEESHRDRAVRVDLDLEAAEHEVRVSLQNERGAAKTVMLRDHLRGGIGEFFGTQQGAAVVVDGVLGILESVAGEQEHDTILGGDLALSDEFLEAGQGNGGGGLAADAFGADLGLGQGNLLLGGLFTPAAGLFKGGDGLAPGGWVANANRAGSGVSGDGVQFASAVCLHGPVKGIGAFGLDDADAGKARNQAELVHFAESLAERGAVGEVAAGHDQVLGNLPVELLDELKGDGFLAFQAIGIDGVEQVNGEAADDLSEQADAAVEVGLDLQRQGAVVHSLRELAPRDFSFGDEDERTHARAGGVGRHGRGGVAGGGAGHPLKATLGSNGQGGGHAGVFERAGGIHALVLGQQPVEAKRGGGAGQVVERGIAFAQRDGVFRAIEDGQQIAEAPNAGLIDGHGGRAALLP